MGKTRVTNEALAVKLDAVAADVSEIKTTLNGNGAPGLKTRIDRLEQAAKSREWSLKMIWTALVGTALTVCANWIWH